MIMISNKVELQHLFKKRKKNYQILKKLNIAFKNMKENIILHITLY